MKKIAGIILVILAVILFTHSIWWSPINFFVPHTPNIDRSFAVDNGDTIEFDVTSENLTILPTEDEELKIEVTGRDLNRVNFQVDQEHRELKINLNPKWYSFSNANDLKLMVYVPRTKLINLDVKANTRVVQVGHNQGAKWNIAFLNTEIKNGTSYFKNVKVNHFIYDGTSTDVMVDRVESKNTNIGTFSGNINISHYVGPLHLSSTSGNIRMQLDKLVGDIRTEVLSGKVDMFLPKSASFQLNTNLQSGQLISTYPLQNKKTTTPQTTASAGTGKFKINIEIVNGDLIIH
ncbi:DUF4097 family beta strand repeat-containing protein [Shimazuella alba]|uniref:DUF4097 family beta strand repeat protein n=1 Tax=Shimazuella alba TaxID=2690964 RepID=A0A6I4VS82_9BACL|nr:DUF4097 family beta strand repeat-containing protein [Shimazuella alba]MXQ53105.1 DUF4097 family beta strand repeat protein [Shimazuella alba]